MKRLVCLLTLFASPALAQQLPDAARLAPIYRQQRDMQADGLAQCTAVAADLQAKVAELEKKLAEAKKE